MTEAHTILTSMPWFAWVAVVAVISGCISGILKMKHQHTERMAMIQQGMNPDALDAKPASRREV